MKRILILLMLLIALPLAARAENQLIPMQNVYNSDGLLSDGETLYIITGEGLTAWRSGDEAPAIWEDKIELPSDRADDWRTALDGLRLFLDGDAVRGAKLTLRDGEAEALLLCDLALEDGAVYARNVQTLKLPNALKQRELYQLSGLCAREGVYTLLFGTESGHALCVVDAANPAGMRVADLDIWDITRLFAAPEGPLLVIEAYDDPTISRVGPDADLQVLCHLPVDVTGIAVSPDTGAVFAALDGRVCPVDLATGALGEAVAALPARVDSAAVLDGGTRYVAAIWDTLLAADVTRPIGDQATLTVTEQYNDWYSRALLRFSALHPEVALASVNTPAEDVLSAMLTRSDAVDVYVLDCRDAGGALGTLLDRGYALPLDGSAAVADFCDRLYPGLREAVCRDGAPVAVPLYVQGWALALDETLLEAMGLSDIPLPDTWAEFLDLLENEIKPRLSSIEGLG